MVPALMVASVKDRIETIRRTRKRPRAVVTNWMRREPHWLRECIAEEWQRQTGQPITDTKDAPSTVPTDQPQPHYWWQDD